MFLSKHVLRVFGSGALDHAQGKIVVKQEHLHMVEEGYKECLKNKGRPKRFRERGSIV